MKNSLIEKESEYYRTMSYFMEFHRDEIEPDLVKKLFSADDPSSLTCEKMVDFLEVRRFGSQLDSQLKQQLFIMDLSFTPEITNELMVVYFNPDQQILTIAHES